MIKTTNAADPGADSALLEVVRRAPAALYQFRVSSAGVYSMPFVSPAFSGPYGLEGKNPAETASTLFSRIHRADFPAVRNAIATSVETLADLLVEFRFNQPGGNEVWLEARAYAHRTPEGDVVLNGVANNITARKSAEASARQKERHFRTVLDALQDAYFQTDLSGRFVQVSPSAVKMCGYASPSELLGQPSSILYANPKERDRLVAAVERKGFVGDRVGQGKRKDGSTFWISLNAQPWFDEQGKLAGIEGVVRDITQRMTAANALAESEARYRVLFQNAAEGIVLVDPVTTQFHYANPAFCTMFGYTPLELEQLTLKDVHPSDVLERIHAEFESMINGAPVTSLAIPCVRKDGTRFAVDARGSLVEVGGRESILGFLTDTTERVRLEDRLRQSQKMDAVGQLAGGVAHNFNNAMMVVLTNAELLLAEIPRQDPKRELLNDIRSAAERAASLTQQLLAFGRKQMLTPRVVDLNILLARLGRMLDRVIGEDIELRLELNAVSSWAKVDPGQVEQVITNLVLNARDAMPRGGRVTVSTRNLTSKKGLIAESSLPEGMERLAISVTDMGEGIRPEIRPRLFEPFFTTKEFGKGSGLGLATVFGIVKQSGGDIAVESEVGRGSTFTVLLPSEPVGKRPPGSGEPAAFIPRGSETILVVEDEESVGRVVRVTLESAGYRVLVARNGPEALEVAAAHVGDIPLVLTDVVMPELSGQDFAERLRTTRPDSRFLFMSGYADEIVSGHGAVQSEGFLQKPFSPLSLANKVREVLDARARR